MFKNFCILLLITSLLGVVSCNQTLIKKRDNKTDNSSSGDNSSKDNSSGGSIGGSTSAQVEATRPFPNDGSFSTIAPSDITGNKFTIDGITFTDDSLTNNSCSRELSGFTDEVFTTGAGNTLRYYITNRRHILEFNRIFANIYNSASNNNGSIVVLRDIDLCNFELQPLAIVSNGMIMPFNGNNKVIFDFKISKDNTTYSNRCIGFFCTATYSIASNINIANLGVLGKIDTSSFTTQPANVGGVIAIINGGKIENIKSVVTIKTTATNTGGVVGTIQSSTPNSGDKNVIVRNITNSGAVSGGSKVGGIVGFNNTNATNTTFERITNDGRISSTTSGSVGAYFGQYLNGLMKPKNCSNNGTPSNIDGTTDSSLLCD